MLYKLTKLAPVLDDEDRDIFMELNNLSTHLPRLIEEALIPWCQSQKASPMLLRGARQVGKSHLVKYLGKKYFDQFIEINFERNPELASLFSTNNVDEIWSSLEIRLRKSLRQESCLLFLDEIQMFPDLISRLRWFAEDMPQLHVIAAGSLLDFALSETQMSMPVGRVTFRVMGPLSYLEFLRSVGEGKLFQKIKSLKFQSIINSINPINPIIHAQALKNYQLYTFIGGMPKVVQAFINNNNSLIEIGQIQHDIIESFFHDFNKYKGRVPATRLQKVFLSVPHQLGKKISYAQIDREEKASALNHSLTLLKSARVVTSCEASYCNGISLGAETDEKNRKFFFLDTGLAMRALDLRMDAPASKPEDIMLVNSGRIAEQLVAQALWACESQRHDPQLYFWSRQKKGADAEVDFVLQSGTSIVPVEVKAGSSGSLKSLHQMMSEKKLKFAIRLDTNLPSLQTVRHDGYEYKLLSLPIYLAEIVPQLLGDFIRTAAGVDAYD